jgi:hypothetical protein
MTPILRLFISVAGLVACAYAKHDKKATTVRIKNNKTRFFLMAPLLSVFY